MLENVASCENEITKALLVGTEALTQQGWGKWTFTLKNGHRLDIRGQLDGGYLTLSTPVASPPTVDLRRFADSQRLLPAAVKVALSKEHDIDLTAELVVDQSAGLASEIPNLLRGLKEGSERLIRPSQKDQRQRNRKRGPRMSAGNPSVVELAKDSGCPFKAHTGDKVVFPLGGEGFRRVVLVRNPKSEEFVASAELSPMNGAGDDSIRAVCALLLRVSGSVYLARGFLSQTESPHAGIEVRLAAAATAGQVADAVAAIDTACELCQREIPALLDSGVANRYLELQGWNERQDP